MSVEASVTIEAPLERAWAAVIDFEARPRWAPRVKEASIVGGGPLREGSRIVLRVGRELVPPDVAELRPPERLVLVVRALGVRAQHVYGLRADADATVVTMTGHYGGPLGGIFGRLMRGAARRDLYDELQAVKLAAEAG